MTPWTLVSAASQQRIKPSDQGIFQLDWTLGLIRLVFTSSGPYRNHLHRKKLLPLLSNLHLKDFYNKQRRRWKKNKREDERQKENFLFGFFNYLIEYEAARFVNHKQIVDSRCHFCHKATRELLLLLLPPRETIANATSKQTTKASESGTRGAPNPNLPNPNSFPDVIIFMIIICEINLF